MPLRTPMGIPSVSIADIWSYVARTLTDPDSYKADISALLTTALFNARATEPRIRGGHVEVGWVIAPATETLAGGSGDMAERTVTPTIPADATLVRAKLIAMITALNMTATLHKVDVTIQGRKGAGAWGNILVDTEVFGLPATDGTTTCWAGAYNVAVVDEAGVQYGFRFTLAGEGTPANTVRYTQGYVLILEYRMD